MTSLTETLSGIVESLRNKGILTDAKIKPVDIKLSVDAREITIAEISDLVELEDTVLYRTGGKFSTLRGEYVADKNDNELTAVKSGTKLGYINADSFSYCNNLAQLDFNQNMSAIAGTGAFNGDSSLSTIILRREDNIVILENTNSFAGIYSGYKVYVVDELYDNYINADQWNNISSHI